jgi:hypothetical protein
MSDDLAHELRVIARLMETKVPVTFRERDAAQLRKAAAEIERLSEAIRAEREAILKLIESERVEGHLYDARITRCAPLQPRSEHEGISNDRYR